MWECGLKQYVRRLGRLGRVTPYVGVWIETFDHILNRGVDGVTPYVGVWIETLLSNWIMPTSWVTPYVGVWIETSAL